MARVEVEDLLRLHAAAYGTLLHLDRLAAEDPDWLGPEALKQLRHPRRCAEWIESKRALLAKSPVPAPDDHPAEFAGLLSSFFETSFDARSFVWDGEVQRSGIQRQYHRRDTRGVATALVEAVAYQLSRDGAKTDRAVVRKLVEREELWVDALVVGYVWHLERRAIGKSKGPVAHQMWTLMPYAVRKLLSAESVRLARGRLLEAAKLARNAESD
jgi:hypothetical protein